MTLLNAPVYDEGKEKLKVRLLIAAGVLVALVVLITLGGFLAGHGWAFSNYPAEHRVGEFFAALEAKDYGKAFAIYNNDPAWQQHPEKYKDYSEARFKEDWATQDPIKGPGELVPCGYLEDGWVGAVWVGYYRRGEGKWR